VSLPSKLADAAAAHKGKWLAAITGSVLLGVQHTGGHRSARCRKQQRGIKSVVMLRAAAAGAAAPTAVVTSEDEAKPKDPPTRSTGKPLQVVKIDLETNRVIVGEDELQELDRQLRAAQMGTGVQKVCVVGVMGAYRTGKSFLLDLMLRYLSETANQAGGKEACEIPPWAIEREVPDWVIRCGESMSEGRQDADVTMGQEDGFLWRPGMDKCTEGIWIWSQPFIRKTAEGEDVALLLMDTQGAWDAKMTEEQSATVFGLTTLLASRLIYNISKQIQQDKIDNLVYFTDFAQAALRTQLRDVGTAMDQGMHPFQALDFLVRDWPHYVENATVDLGRKDMERHLQLYQGEQTASATSMKSLSSMFEEVDVWCLPHPSLEIEKSSWTGDLAVIEPQFWRFLDSYMEKIFSPAGLQAKTNLGAEISVDAFSQVLQEFIYAFRDAAPQAKTFGQAMQSSTSLLARDAALKVYREQMVTPEAGIRSEDFEALAKEASKTAEAAFNTKALFGTEEQIQEASLKLKSTISEETARLREENERRLESTLGGLTDISLAATAAFVLDRASDFTCDWWSEWCRDLSGDLFFFYMGVIVYAFYNINNVKNEQGDFGAALSAMELSKSMVRRVKTLTAGTLAEAEADSEQAAKPEDDGKKK